MAKGRIEIRRDRCKGCYLCVRACPADVIQADTVPSESGVYTAAVGTGTCIACGGCCAVCPDMCISVYKEGAA